jgi:hypothetical protein
MVQFPEKLYGRCPIGHNLAPSSDTGDNLSTTLIDSNEEQPLFWSNYYQDYICKFCKRREQDEIDDENFHEREVEKERQRQDIGIVKSSDYSAE